VCGDYTIKLNQKIITPLIKEANELYFGSKIGDQDKPWAPHIVCANCAVYLRGWLKGSQKSMPFALPIVWQEQKDHLTDCCFCLTKISGISLKSKHNIQYPSLPSAIRPELHSQDLPVPKPPEKWTIDDDNNDDEPVLMEQDISDPDFQPSTSNEPHFISQGEVSDLVRDLN
jgi:hypothetical protein